LRVGIVGAGISGLAAARSLKAASHDVVLFEKAAEVGGRCGTVEIEGYRFDPGATSIAPRGLCIEKVMLEELDTSDLLRVEKPIFTHQGLRITPGDREKNSVPRYTYTTGNVTLPRLLAVDQNVRFNTPVESLEVADSGFRILDEHFDAAILTPPVPKTAAILWSIGESRSFANVRYRCCLSVMLGFALPNPVVNYHALLDPDQRHPITWLSLESVKSTGRAPEGHCAIVVQLGPSYSLAHFSDPDEKILGDTVDYLQYLYGKEWDTPEVSKIKRWKYSQPESTALFDSVNPPGSRLVIAGDGVLAGRVENAFECGVKAAQLLLDPVNVQ
jgi:renalase